MAKPSTGRVIQGLLKFHYQHPHRLLSDGGSVSAFQNSSAKTYSTSTFLSSRFQSKPPTSSNWGLSQLLSPSKTSNLPPSQINYHPSRIFTNSSHLSPKTHLKPSAFSPAGLGFGKLNLNSSGFRYFSSKTSNIRKANGNLAKSVIDKPVSAVRSAVSRYRDAVGLQIDAFWKRNSMLLVGAVGVVVCGVLWRVMFGIAHSFVGLSEGMAKYGFLALSSAIVAFSGLYIRSRFAINPDKVYRIAMTKLNTSAAILEIMGAPLSGTSLRAYVMSGGGLTLKNFKPTLRSKRCFLIFPIRGSERKGLVSVEVKKKKGQYDMKLLAIDIPMATGPDQRIFLIGDEVEYKVGGGLISELRDPVVKAMAATKEFENLDQLEDEEDEKRELQEAERKHQEEIEKLESKS